MAKMSEEQYEAQKKRAKLYRNIFEPLVAIFLFAARATLTSVSVFLHFASSRYKKRAPSAQRRANL